MGNGWSRVSGKRKRSKSARLTGPDCAGLVGPARTWAFTLNEGGGSSRGF